MQLYGVIPPVVTPMHDDESLDLPRLGALIDRQLSAGVHGIFVLGTTGEFYAVDADEKRAIIAAAVAHVNRRVPVLAGTGGITTRDAVRLTQMAEREGADAVSVITPFFIQPTQQEMFDYFRQVAEATRLPVLLYTNPAMTGGVKLDVGTVARLAEIPNVVGIKDSGGDLTTLIEYVRATPAEFAVFQGRDTLIEPALCYGAKGAVPGTANIAPELAVAIYTAHQRGDAIGAREAQRRFSPVRLALSHTTAPGGIKVAMSLLGVSAGPNRGPIGLPTEAEREKIKAVLRRVIGS
ncbi:MAG: 4-hydroxy-tetrahydrodipicolinate synthase [Gemmataceae bacterium]